MAALLLCAAAAVAVQELTPVPPATTLVLAAARDLPAGHTLIPGDLITSAVNPSTVPAGSLFARASEAAADLRQDGQPGKGPPGSGQLGDGQVGSAFQDSADGAMPVWVGSRVSRPVRRGEVMTDAALLGDGLLVGAPPGSQAVPLRLTDPTTVQLLRQGQLVDVVLSSSKGLDGPMHNDVLARSVPVLWAPALAAPAAGLLPAQDAEGLVVVAATRDQSVSLAGAAARGKVFLILVK